MNHPAHCIAIKKRPIIKTKLINISVLIRVNDNIESQIQAETFHFIWIYNRFVSEFFEKNHWIVMVFKRKWLNGWKYRKKQHLLNENGIIDFYIWDCEPAPFMTISLEYTVPSILRCDVICVNVCECACAGVFGFAKPCSVCDS